MHHVLEREAGHRLEPLGDPLDLHGVRGGGCDLRRAGRELCYGLAEPEAKPEVGRELDEAPEQIRLARVLLVRVLLARHPLEERELGGERLRAERDDEVCVGAGLEAPRERAGLERRAGQRDERARARAASRAARNAKALLFVAVEHDDEVHAVVSLGLRSEPGQRRPSDHVTSLPEERRKGVEGTVVKEERCKPHARR